MTKYLIVAALFGLSGCEQAEDAALDDIQMKVAADAVEKYEMVARHGTPIDKCVHAGIVSAAYLQAQDEPKYRHWKAIENLNCANAGL